MKILEITFEEPSYFSGGGIGIKQSMSSLSKIGKVDYIGPHFDEHMFGDDSNVCILYELEHDKKIASRVKGIVKGVLNGYYASWMNAKKKIVWEEYDLIHIEFTKYPFLVKEALDSGVPVLTRMHNVERDYYYNLFKRKKSLSNLITYLCYQNAEKKVVSLSTKIIALTQEDVDRAIELYGNINEKMVINPVCIEGKEYCDSVRIYHYLLMTGSLWYGPNADGIIWFINEVWPIIRNEIKDVKLIVAGGNPQTGLKELCVQQGIKLVENPDDMEPIFRKAGVYVAPIFSGAGMKVKIAEALMYGLPIYATRHALLGYEQGDSIKECNTVQDFVRELCMILTDDFDNYKMKSISSRQLYEKKYSIECSSDFYMKLINLL